MHGVLYTSILYRRPWLMGAGGQAVPGDRQGVAADHAEGTRRPQRGTVLRRRRDARPSAAAPARTARSLPEVSHRVCCRRKLRFVFGGLTGRVW